MCSRTELSLTLFPRGGALSCHNTVAPNSWCHSSHCKEGISEFTGSVVIYADVTQNKMCLADICGAAQIKPTHEQNQGKKRRSLCATELIQSSKHGLAGLTKMENLLQGLLTLSISLYHHWPWAGSKYNPTHRSWEIFSCFFSTILGSVLLIGNYVNLCFIIFSFVCVYELEWNTTKVPQNTNLKK